MKALTKKQLAVLAITARRAYDTLTAAGYSCGEFQQWRRMQTRIHTGKFSWKECAQVDYIPLYNAFAVILSRPQKTERNHTEKERAIIWNIQNVARQSGMNNGYLARLIAGKTSRPWITAETDLDAMLAGINETTLRHILYTLQARARAKRKQLNN